MNLTTKLTFIGLIVTIITLIVTLIQGMFPSLLPGIGSYLRTLEWYVWTIAILVLIVGIESYIIIKGAII